MYAQLGNIRFEGLKGFTSLEETFAMNYAQHERINNKPRLEATGEALDVISFDMYLHSEFTDPEADIKAIREAVKNREILTLILGNGTVVGDFVITTATKSTNFTDPTGNIIEAIISVELLESYNEDRLKTSKDNAKKEAFATTQRNSNVRTVLSPKLSKGMVTSTNVAKLEASSVKIRQNAYAVKADPATSNFYSGKTSSLLDGMEGNINTINEILSGSGELSGLAPDLPGMLEFVYSEIQNMRAVLPITDIDSFFTFVNQLQLSIDSVKQAAKDIFNKSIIRSV